MVVFIPGGLGEDAHDKPDGLLLFNDPEGKWIILGIVLLKQKVKPPRIVDVIASTKMRCRDNGARIYDFMGKTAFPLVQRNQNFFAQIFGVLLQDVAPILAVVRSPEELHLLAHLQG